MKRKNRRLSQEDLDVFHSAMAGVRPITSDKVPLESLNTRRARVTTEEYEPSEQCYLDLPESEREVGQNEVLFFHRGGLQLKSLQKLKRGAVNTEAELDLHGLKREAASQVMLQFLNECIEQGISQVRIVHGKGTRSLSDNPVLKGMVANTLPQHRYVLAFASAPQHQGGAGAVNIVLKKHK